MREVFKWRKSEVEFILKIEQKRYGVYAIVSLKLTKETNSPAYEMWSL